ncbi:MAG: autotransporter outer membrane beta-barrel domain-containing protein, partial [Verrucomicrobiales bacterium]|nr:autotransporter outer membrane beta-barrel domain-containing protein [Verrucomicrobiales bacterium]
MKKHRLTKWTALFTTICGMAALPLNAVAQYGQILAMSTTRTTVVGGTYSYARPNAGYQGETWFAIGSGLIIGDQNTVIQTSTSAQIAVYTYNGGIIQMGDHATVINKTDNWGIQAQGGLVSAGDGLRVFSQGSVGIALRFSSMLGILDLGNHAEGFSGHGGLTSDVGGTITGTNVTIYTGLQLDADSNPVDANGVPTADPAKFVSNERAAIVFQARNGGLIELWDAKGVIVSGSGSIISTLNSGTVILHGGELTGNGALLVSSGGITFGTSTVVLEQVVAQSTGTAVMVTGDETLNLTVIDTSLTGNVLGSGSAIIDVTLSGSDSTFLGDIAQHDTAVVTVTLSDGATGRGGFNDGNLITGSDSAWTFDKDSHGNYGENNGTWNIGDYEVIFDNMIHTGTLNISVNSDTGEGGSITVTDTADGDGTVHIDTTGDGKADPNKVLPNIVSGDGTENWQWDPIDWGIDQLIKDGDHFVKNGTSPAGAVLNSSVAIQQALWFAQQNSLLKRMGELRYGARASRPPAGGTPALHIIENIWLRSYGQQLNVGSQVAGKAYEQLIYGVDLGTDHKFIISADSDLYLGVYAGYGRSDIDYRTPGTDGEINSYYGGLYATWLHSSGFYIDATFKAASVNNDLKAPYGNTQLTASYSDVNIGGSIEIGNKFTFADDWFIEPQLQVNYL